jgi:hypothetical protein
MFSNGSTAMDAAASRAGATVGCNQRLPIVGVATTSSAAATPPIAMLRRRRTGDADSVALEEVGPMAGDCCGETSGAASGAGSNDPSLTETAAG